MHVTNEPCTMSQWNWFKHKLKRRLNKNYTKEAEMYWEFITNPVYESMRNDIEIISKGIPIPDTTFKEKSNQ